MRILFKTSVIVLLFICIVTIINSCRKDEVPLVTTSGIINITANSATCGGTITNEGSGNIIARGVCWAEGITPTISDNKTTDGEGPGTFASNIAGLAGATTYYVRAYATNKSGTGYGDEINFHTAPYKINFSEWIHYGNVTDQDGNIYRTVKIGEQTWMAENLRATHYQDGSPIPNVPDLTDWIMLYDGAYCFYNNDTLNKNVYGGLYNWYTLADPHKICPAGWHIPSDAEWTILTDFLGGKDIAGMSLKEAGFGHWASPNTGGSNQSGFSALPAGTRYPSIKDDFLGMGHYCRWWSSTEDSLNRESAWYRSLNTNNIVVERNYYWKIVSYSVRCLKD